MTLCCRIIAQILHADERKRLGRWGVHGIYIALDRLLSRVIRQSDVRRAGILGIFFGLLMCVVVSLACVVFGLVAELGA